MQLIADLEPTPRGIYCGAVGLVAPPSAAFRARFNVAIRTVVVDRTTGEAVYGAGGGITWGSEAAPERAELHAKAAVLAHDVTEHRLLETLAFVPGEGLRNLDRHLARMADSADWAGFRFDRPTSPTSVRRAVARRIEPARVRILLSRDGDADVELQAMPPTGTRPVRLVLDDEPVDAGDPWLQHKSTRRDVYLTRALRHPEADDVVLVNQRGELTETTTANLAVRLDGRWWTPPTTSGCLPGVERGRLLELGPPARARPVRPRPARRGGARRAQFAAGLARGAAARRATPGRRRELAGGWPVTGRDEPDGQSIGEFLGQLAARMAAPGAGRHRRRRGRAVGLAHRDGRALHHRRGARGPRGRDRGGGRRAAGRVPAGRRRRRDSVLGRRRGDEAAPRHDGGEGRTATPPLRGLAGRDPAPARRPRLGRTSWWSWPAGCCRSPTATWSATSPPRPPPPAPPPRPPGWPWRRTSPGIDDEAARADLVSAVAVVEDLARRADEIEAEVRKSDAGRDRAVPAAASSWGSSTSRRTRSPTGAATTPSRPRSRTGSTWRPPAPTTSTSAASRRGPAPAASTVEEELRRVLPVVAELARSGVAVSIDTTRSRGGGGRRSRPAPSWSTTSAAAWRTPPWPGSSPMPASPGSSCTGGATAATCTPRPRTTTSSPTCAGSCAGASTRRWRRAWRPSGIVVDPGLGFAKQPGARSGPAGRPGPHHRARLPRPGRRLPQALPRRPARGAGRTAPATRRARQRHPRDVSVLAARAGAWGVRVHDVAGSADAVRVVAAVAAGTRAHRAARRRCRARPAPETLALTAPADEHATSTNGHTERWRSA